ncbi:MAG: TIM barrel protein [Verrucomicrobiota bacterium]
MNRRNFLAATAATTLSPKLFADNHSEKPLFEISLAQWSNHRMLKGGQLNNLDWPKYAKQTYDIHALEYVSQFFKDKAQDAPYLAELNKRVGDLNMINLLVMIDGEGHLGADTEAARDKTVENHKKWVEAAKTLGCHSIRVNAYSKSEANEAAKQVTDGLFKLASFARDFDINVIVENHGGHSSNGKWLAGVLSAVNLPNCGSLPDFGNFHDYDRYQGIKDLMPFAKGVSAKSHDFDEQGNETKTNFSKAMKLVLAAGYQGYVGVEYEGKILSEDDGVKATKTLLEKVRQQLS